MGNKISGMFKKMFAKKEAKVLMLGLDSAGKTTILYQLKLGMTLETIPTMGFVHEKISHKKFTMNVWDIAGQDTLRPLWRQYYDNTNAIIFIIDSSDVNRIDLAKEELHNLLIEPKLENSIIAIVANKIDMDVLNHEQVEEQMEIENYKEMRTIKCFPAIGISGQGLAEMLDWVGANIKKKK
jgi:small GTP-binding protein